MRKYLKDEYVWHDWFAWYPITVFDEDLKKIRVLGEMVQRKRTATMGGEFIYRLKQNALPINTI